jgi:metal-dependent hydrolase (beta-lactamase superfamily II)
MNDGITVRILGDSGPFSKLGKSIGYQITIGKTTYLFDCGATLFQQIGGQNLKNVKGVIISHCHDDHKRWFTDMAIFNRYAKDITNKVHLLASEDVNSELFSMAQPALDRTLSDDSKTIIDVPYDRYVDYSMLGPAARYRIAAMDEGDGKSRFCIIDREGNIPGPERAKIVISDITKRPRMLFRDPDLGEWVEPESFYAFSSNLFYEENKNVFSDPEGFTIEAIKAPVWHGLPNIGIKIRTQSETLIFSSDTVHNTDLWKQLYKEKRNQNLQMPRMEFESASVIYGDINDYIERTWSEQRYEEAVKSFADAVVIHDISVRDSIVHTSYDVLKKTTLNSSKTILTHSPDMITSEWVLSGMEKRFRIKGDDFFEISGDKLYPMNADIYHKENGRYYVGYKNDNGNYLVYKKDGMLYLSDKEVSGGLFRVDIYEDVSGKYFPKIEDESRVYRERKDGKVEIVEYTDNGSRGEIVEDCRPRLAAERKEKSKLRVRNSQAGS